MIDVRLLWGVNVSVIQFMFTSVGTMGLYSMVDECGTHWEFVSSEDDTNGKQYNISTY